MQIIQFSKINTAFICSIFIIQSLIIQQMAATDDLLCVTNINQSAVYYVGNDHLENGRMQLELLKREGLQKNDYVLEIGCGALVAGIPIMLFLEKNHYVGIDPNKWLIEASLEIKENKDIVNARLPIFLYNDAFDASPTKIEFNYIIAHSIMSHAAHWQLPLFLQMCAKVLKPGGKLVFSMRLTEANEFGNPGSPCETKAEVWQYPGVAFFHKSTVIAEASRYFTNIEHKKMYTKLITSTDGRACHDWFVLTK